MASFFGYKKKNAVQPVDFDDNIRAIRVYGNPEADPQFDPSAFDFNEVFNYELNIDNLQNLQEAIDILKRQIDRIDRRYKREKKDNSEIYFYRGLDIKSRIKDMEKQIEPVRKMLKRHQEKPKQFVPDIREAQETGGRKSKITGRYDNEDVIAEPLAEAEAVLVDDMGNLAIADAQPLQPSMAQNEQERRLISIIQNLTDQIAALDQNTRLDPEERNGRRQLALMNREDAVNQLENLRARLATQRGRGIKAYKNSWITHVKKYQKKHGCSYKEAMKLAKKTYI